MGTYCLAIQVSSLLSSRPKILIGNGFTNGFQCMLSEQLREVEEIGTKRTEPIRTENDTYWCLTDMTDLQTASNRSTHFHPTILNMVKLSYNIVFLLPTYFKTNHYWRMCFFFIVIHIHGNQNLETMNFIRCKCGWYELALIRILI